MEQGKIDGKSWILNELEHKTRLAKMEVEHTKNLMRLENKWRARVPFCAGFYFLSFWTWMAIDQNNYGVGAFLALQAIWLAMLYVDNNPKIKGKTND